MVTIYLDNACAVRPARARAQWAEGGVEPAVSLR
jgi:hypothetical protein